MRSAPRPCVPCVWIAFAAAVIATNAQPEGADEVSTMRGLSPREMLYRYIFYGHARPVSSKHNPDGRTIASVVLAFTSPFCTSVNRASAHPQAITDPTTT
jgi:hypothetical protein